MTSLMILVAGPYRSGTGDDPALMRANLRVLETAALELYRAGHIPMIGEWVALPLLEVAGAKGVGDALWDELVYPVAHRLLAKCDAVLRLPGVSRGADEDVRMARERGLPVYFQLEEVPGHVVIRPLTAGEAAAMKAWRYPAPYEIYNDDDAQAHDPDLATTGFYAIVEDGELVGFCSFGADARVPGGNYPEGPLDLGMGMRPDRTGRGLGARYITAAIDFARRELRATSLRATVAEINARALRLCERAGFQRRSRFDGLERAFWILSRD